MPIGTKPKVTSQTQTGKKIVTTDVTVTGTEIGHQYRLHSNPRSLVLLDCHPQQSTPDVRAALPH